MIESMMIGLFLMFVGAMALALVVGIVSETCGFIAWFARIIWRIMAALAHGLWRGIVWLVRLFSRIPA